MYDQCVASGEELTLLSIDTLSQETVQPNYWLYFPWTSSTLFVLENPWKERKEKRNGSERSTTLAARTLRSHVHLFSSFPTDSEAKERLLAAYIFHGLATR